MWKRLVSVYEYWLDWKIGAKITSTILNVTLIAIAVLLVTYYVINSRQAENQIGAQWITLENQILKQMDGTVADEIRILETLAQTPSLVEALDTANHDRASWTESDILQKDKAWAGSAAGMEATVQQIAGSDLSIYLKEFQKNNPQEAEVFVTDLKGLNVGMTDRTSDFLQADETWWTSTFADGQGSIYVGPVEYDESSKTYAMNIGIPIRDGNTKQVSGVLRGTLDISVMIHALQNMEVGKTGNILLIDPQGVILYSRDAQEAFKTAPDSILALLKMGQSGWTTARNLQGKSTILAYSRLPNDTPQTLGWRIVISQSTTEANRSIISSLLLSGLAGILIALIGTFLCRIVIKDSIAAPLETLTGMAHELSVGNILQETESAKRKFEARRDEIGEISRAFQRLTAYFQSTASAAVSIANKNLAIDIRPNSEYDELGKAFAKMVGELNRIVSQISESAETVSASASQLATASETSGKTTNQIATTMQQIATGTTQQSEEISKTSSSVEQLGQAIEGVATGAQEQSKAIGQVYQFTTNINTALTQAANNAEQGVQGAAHAADAARSGSKTVETTIQAMQTIKGKVNLAVQKVREMGRRSEQIDVIVEAIDDIAAQTNLLALNAAIEAARVEAKGEKTVEKLLQQHMLGVVDLIADMLKSGRELDSKDLMALAQRARVEDLCIADADGVIYASNQTGSVGFRFSENPRLESSVFRPLLNQRDGIVVRPIVVRDQDHKPYIYVGVSRRDQAGIVQAGMPADLVYSLGGYSRGFAVVANEVSKLSEHAKQSTKEIAVLIRDLQKTVGEAVTVMEESAHDVETGSNQAAEAGKSLTAILAIAEAVSRQVQEIAAAVQHMNQSSQELVKSMEMVSTVVEANTSATEHMAADSSSLTQAVENIASVSEENSAAIEEVSAATQEILLQVEQVAFSASGLMQMAHGLQSMVAQFSLPKRS